MKAEHAKLAAEKAAHDQSVLQHKLNILTLNQQVKEKEQNILSLQVRINELIEEKLRQEGRITINQSINP